MPIESFERLACYQHALALYEFANRAANRLPEHQRCLADEIHRASLDVLTEIAGGYTLLAYPGESEGVRFFSDASGSLAGTFSALIAAHEIGLLSDADFESARQLYDEADSALASFCVRFREENTRHSGEDGG